jgi:hypothetical protein
LEKTWQFMDSLSSNTQNTKGAIAPCCLLGRPRQQQPTKEKQARSDERFFHAQ